MLVAAAFGGVRGPDDVYGLNELFLGWLFVSFVGTASALFVIGDLTTEDACTTAFLGLLEGTCAHVEVPKARRHTFGVNPIIAVLAVLVVLRRTGVAIFALTGVVGLSEP